MDKIRHLDKNNSIASDMFWLGTKVGDVYKIIKDKINNLIFKK